MSRTGSALLRAVLAWIRVSERPLVSGCVCSRLLGSRIQVMEDAPRCEDCGDGEAINPLDVMAGVAAGAADLPTNKRRAADKAGRDCCWVEGCGCNVGLVGVPTALVADASYIMQHEMSIEFGKHRGRPRLLPANESQNRLCRKHRPTNLPAKQVIGALVLIQHDGRLIPARVIGPAPVAVGRAGRAARAARAVAAPTSIWRAESEADSTIFQDLATAAVWTNADLRATYDASLKRAAADVKKAKDKKIDALEHQVKYHKMKRAAEKGGGEKERSPGRPAAPRPSPPPDAAPPPSLVARVSVTIVLPDDWEPGDLIRYCRRECKLKNDTMYTAVSYSTSRLLTGVCLLAGVPAAGVL